MPAKLLSEADLKEISGQKTLRTIQKLDLTDYGIRSIDGSLFSKLSTVTELDLSDNNVTEIPQDMTLPWLEALDLTNNDIKSIEFVRQFPRLQHLYLEGNKKLEPSDKYIAAVLCPTLESCALGRVRSLPLQTVVQSFKDKLQGKVYGVWEAIFSDRCQADQTVEEGEAQDIMDEFTAVLKKQDLKDDTSLVKFHLFMVDQIAAEIVNSKKCGSATTPYMREKRQTKRKLDIIYEEDVLETIQERKGRRIDYQSHYKLPSVKKKKHRNGTTKRSRVSSKSSSDRFTKLMQKGSTSSPLPIIDDYNPVHFVRCHSLNNAPDDDTVKVWNCAFEPDPQNPEKSTDIVATCGGNTICLLDCKTGKVMKRYKDEEESFYCMAWTCVTMTTDKGAEYPANILAAAGKDQDIKLIHPKQLVVYASMKGHKKAVQCLLFHPNEPTHLFSGSDDSRIILWDIAVPNPVTYKTKWSRLRIMQTPGMSVLNIAYSSRQDWLLASCERGCYGWNLQHTSSTDIQPILVYSLPEVEEEDCCVDGLAILSNDVVVTKCVGQDKIYLWRLEDHTLPKKMKSTKLMDVDPCACLEYPLTTIPYINLCTSSNVLTVGDDNGRILLYNLKQMTKKQKSCYQIFHNSRELVWPEVSLGKRRQSSGQEEEGVVINMVAISSDGEHLVCGTDKNLVCIWRRE